MTREELLVERITYITKIALGEELNNMLGIEVDKDFNEAIMQASIKAAKVGMKFADTHPRWISVEEEPKINPNDSEWEYSDDVLVALKDGSIAVGRYERDNSTGEHYWVLYGVDKDLVVTHWMPLPQAPKKGGEE